ncbi:MAG TPA: transposase [Actinomycetota bacterium]|nr:transposase [Actinomycetota bacterium]
MHTRLAWRLAEVVVGALLASGRRTAAAWWRAAGVGEDFRSYYYFLDSLGRKAGEVAAVLLRIVLDRIEARDRLIFALDDTPTQRYGPKVQGAGIHHNPTPGPAGSKFLYGHSWVTLSRVARHARCGAIGLPLLGMRYVRTTDVPGLPAGAGVAFRTKLEMAAEAVRWLGSQLPGDAVRPWVVVDGGYTKREFLKPAKAAGFVVVARLRKDAALCGLPPVLPPGAKRGPGRPPTYGKDHLSLAKRAGQGRGWKELTVEATTGRPVVKRYKSFLATWRPAGGVVRVVILKEADGSWRAFLCTDPEAAVEAIVQAIHDRWAIEQNYHDLKEVEGIGQVQLRRVWSNIGALNLSLWVHTLVEVWAWDRPEASLSDRSDRPWDDASRRPSHADRCRALRRAMLEDGYQQLDVPGPWSEKIRRMLAAVIKLAA